MTFKRHSNVFRFSV